ncbi:MAG: hypothetical protein AAF514_12265 [Verrucomicrobiota bacterium]
MNFPEEPPHVGEDSGLGFEGNEYWVDSREGDLAGPPVLGLILRRDGDRWI